MWKRVGLVVLASCSSGYHPDEPVSPMPPPAAAVGPAQLAQIGVAPADGATSICPGAPFQVVVTGTTTDGHQLATPTSYRGGTVWYEEHGLPWARFRLTASIGGMSPAAIYTPPPSVFQLAEAPDVELRVQDLAQPTLTASMHVPVDFRCGQTLALRGQRGGAGANGSAGQSGGAGASVQIAMGRLNTRAHGSLILARVDSPVGRNYYVLEPGGAALVVDLAGGDGGRGGEGLHAQLRYTDTDSSGYTDESKITYEGPPGPGGAGGPGGMAVIQVDASDRLLAHAVKVFNPGGPGGEGGVNGRGMSAVRGGVGPQGPAGPMPQVLLESPAVMFADEIAQGFPIAQENVARGADAARPASAGRRPRR